MLNEKKNASQDSYILSSSGHTTPVARSFATKAVSVGQNVVEIDSVLRSRHLHASSFPDFPLCGLLSLLSSVGTIYPFIKKSFRVDRSKCLLAGELRG